MFRSALAALVFALAASVAAADNYDALVARAKAGEVIDFGALRNAYAESPAYQPYGGALEETKRAMHEAFNAQDCPKVLVSSAKVLDATFVDIEAHLLSGRCFEVAGDQAKAGLHRAVAKGLMDSILASGDGKTTKTAFIVVAIDEEYAVMSALRWRVVGQALIDEDGHAFDRIEVKSATSEETAVLYFQIDRPMAWLSKNLEK